MARPRSPNPSPDARSRRFKRTAARMGLMTVEIYVTPFVIQELVDNGIVAAADMHNPDIVAAQIGAVLDDFIATGMALRDG